MNEGLAHCVTCQEYFKIADILLDDVEVRRICKPDFSIARIESDNNCSSIAIPSEGWTIGVASFLVFATFWNLFALVTFIETSSNHGFFLLGKILVLLIGVGLLFHALFSIYGKTAVFLDKHNISAYRVIFGINHGDTKSTKDLVKIIETANHSDDGTPTYVIAFAFKNGSQITFGSGLAKEERIWLNGELIELQTMYLRG